MRSKIKKSKVYLIGDKDSGYVLKVYGSDNFYADIALKYNELVQLKEILSKKIK